MIRLKPVAPLALALAVAGAAILPVAAQASAKPLFSTAKTNLGTLMDNPATKAVLMKYIPAVITNPQITMARAMTLRQVQPYAGDELSDAKLARIDADLAQLPVQ